MFKNAWVSTLGFIRTLAWLASGPVVATFILSAGTWATQGDRASVPVTVAVGTLIAALSGFVLLRGVSFRRSLGYCLVTAIYLPAYYVVLWGLSLLAPLISGSSIPSNSVFLFFAHPLRPINVAMAYISLVYLLSHVMALFLVNKLISWSQPDV